MNLSALLNGFSTYLEDLGVISSNNDDAVTNVNVFKYSKEFKEYVSEEFKTEDTSIFSKPMTELLSMDVVNGQLIDKESQEANSDSFETVQIQETEDDVIVGLFNNVFSDSSVIQSFGRQNQSELTNEDIMAFLDTVNQADDNADVLSFEDLFAGIDALKVGLSENASLMNESNQLIDDEMQASSYSDNSIGGASYSGSSSYYPSSNSSSKSTKKDNSNLTKLAKLSADELNTELANSKLQLENQYSSFPSVFEKDYEGLKQYKDDMDAKYSNYKSMLQEKNPESARQVESLNNDIQNKQDEIDINTQNITKQENVYSESQNAYNNAVATRESLAATLSSLQSIKIDDPKSEKKQKLSADIANVSAQLKTAQENETTAQKTMKQEEENLKLLNEEKEKFNAELEDYNQQLETLENTIAQEDTEIAASLKEYQDARTVYNRERNSAIQKESSKIKDTQTYINDINTTTTNNSIEETKKSYKKSSYVDYNSEMGEKLAAYAEEYATKRNTVGWCLAGVSNIMKEVYGRRLPFSSAYQAKPAMQGNYKGYSDFKELFKEVEVESKKDLKNLPAGAIVVWDKSASHPHGHISISLGNGKEASDHVHKQYEFSGTDFTVFLPI